MKLFTVPSYCQIFSKSENCFIVVQITNENDNFKIPLIINNITHKTSNRTPLTYYTKRQENLF